MVALKRCQKSVEVLTELWCVSPFAAVLRRLWRGWYGTERVFPRWVGSPSPRWRPCPRCRCRSAGRRGRAKEEGNRDYVDSWPMLDERANDTCQSLNRKIGLTGRDFEGPSLDVSETWCDISSHCNGYETPLKKTSRRMIWFEDWLGNYSTCCMFRILHIRCILFNHLGRHWYHLSEQQK